MKPKDELEKLQRLVEKTNDKEIESPKSKGDFNINDPIEILENTKRSRGRPKGSPNKNLGFRKKDKEAKKKAAKILWGRNMLSWKLDSNQMTLYDAFHNRVTSDLTWMMSRQTGKSYGISVIIIEECLKKPGLRVAYVTPLKSQTRSIVEKNFNQIFSDCPDNLKAKFDTQKSIWSFSNGSIVKVAGMDGGHIESIRGDTFDIVVIDEAGFPSASEFEYALESVLFPTMTISDNPIMVMISTPPKTFDHPFNSYVDKAEAEGTLIIRTLYDCPRLSASQIQKIEDRYGKDSVHFRREFMCERIPDKNTLVIPEATKWALFDDSENKIVEEHKRPPMFKCYTSADYGVMDCNAVLFGYYDWKNATVVIEDELIMKGAEYDTKEMALQIRNKEKELWGEEKIPERYCDNNLQIIRDFTNLYKLPFLATAKDNKQAAVNDVRTKVGSRQLKIHPRCKTLISHIQNATWDKNRMQFKKAIGHHYDALDALIYLIRNIDYFTNPYPADFFLTGDFISPKWEKNKRLSPFEQSIANIFTTNKKR